MKIHEKAKLYDELLKDYIALIDEIKQFQSELAEIPNRSDLIGEKEKNTGNYYAMLSGSFQAMPMALDFRMWKHEANLKFYQRQK
jgi:hypothetical protein